MVLLAMGMLVLPAAGADPVSLASGAVLSNKQVLHIALGVAARSAEPHPKRIEMASGSLKDATSVTDPTGGLGSIENANEEVDLVVMHGYFQIDGSPPHGRSIAPGTVFALIINAHTGTIQEISLANRLPVPLSRLGPVTRLR